MFRRVLLSVLLLVCLSAGLVAQSGISYIYDDLGRLIGVIDQSGNSAVYRYDAVGNLTSIDRYTSSQIAVITLAPSSGGNGATVTIRGSGFSATPSQNAVSFNGTSATVSSASATQLVVTVPSGATTGSVSVTAPAGSASSPSPFVVTTNLAPTITGFTPTTGLAGTAVTLTGTNFDVVLPNDRTRFNVGHAILSAGTSTSLSASVPPSTGSGRISIRTPYGTATSTGDFIIPPSPYSTSDVATSGRLPFATATTVSVGTANKIGLMLFDGTPGQRVSLRATNGLMGQIFGCDVSATLLNPNATALTSGVCVEDSGFLDVTTLPASGTYTVLVDPASTATGSVTLTLYDVPADASASITPGGGAVTLSTTTPGQNGKLTFSGTVGQRISLKGTNGLSGYVFGCDVNVSVLNPDGSQLAVPTCMEGTGFIDVKTLAMTGAYTIKVDPVDIASGSVTLTLYDVPTDPTPSITAGGSAVTVSMPTPGQNAALTFSGTAGQRISLKGTDGLSGYIFGCDVNVSIFNPDGSQLATPTCMEGSGFIDVTTLATTGTYTIKVDPVDIATGSITLTLYNVPGDLAPSITPGGSAVTVNMATPGQNAALTFSGTAGHRIFLQGTNAMTGQIAFACDVNVSILNPDGSQLAAPTCMEGTGFIDIKTLATTGTYSIKVDPVDVASGNLTLTLYDVPADTSGAITAGGSSVTVTTTTPGQNGTLTFSGTVGDRISLSGTNGMTGQVGFACDVNVSILGPDGTTLAPATCMEGSGFIDLKTLATTGTYTIKIDPAEIAAGSVTLTLYSVPADPTTTVAVGGSSATLTTTIPGQNASATFSGTASQQARVHVTNSSMGWVTVKLLKPDGTVLTSTTWFSSSFDLSTQTLPSTGTYTIVVDPDGANTGSITINVTNP